MPKTDDAVTLSHEQLQTLIATAVSAAIAGVRVEPPKVISETDEENFAHKLGREIDQRTPHVEKRVDCLTEMSTRFTAIVVRSRRHPGGRCIRLENYAYPPDIDDLTPANIRKTEKDGALTIGYKMWRANTYYIADLKQYVGFDASRLPVAPPPDVAAAA